MLNFLFKKYSKKLDLVQFRHQLELDRQVSQKCRQREAA